MIHYMDMTFCNAACANESCPRKLTPEVKAKAERWWGKPGAPICYGDLSADCKDYQPLKEKP